jgi:transcriptional regulator
VVVEASVRGNLDLMILSVLAHGPAHGYAQIEIIRQRSGGTFELAEGSLYPALHKLETSGLVRSRWEPVDGRRRRVYELTASGRRSLGAHRRRWESTRDAIDAIVKGPSWARTV